MSPILEVALANSGNEVVTATEVSDSQNSLRSAVVVIPLWNKSSETELFTFKALQSLNKYVDRQKVDMHVVLVDNDSPCKADWRAAARDLGLDADVVNLKKNRGFGPAVNLGAALHPQSDYVVQMNSDCELVEDSVNILADVVERNNLAASMPESYENCKHYGLGKSEDLMGNDWRFGAFWVMRRKWWDLVGGFDEEFEMCYWEDTALFAAIEEEGGRIAGWRGTWVMHKGGASSLPDRDHFFEKNRVLFEKKWGKK